MPNQKYQADLDSTIKAITAGNVKKELVLHIGSTPANLLNLPGLGIVQLPLVIQATIVDKVFFMHGITQKVLAEIHGLISLPQAIYHSDTQAGSVVVVTLKQKSNAEPIIVAIHPGRLLGRSAYNVVTSVYTKPPSVIAKWDAKGLLLK